MFDERAFIAHMETADVDTFADLVEQPTPDEDRALRAYFGDARYRALHRLALRRGEALSRAHRPKGNVVVIHGMLGSHLAVEDHDGGAVRLWPDLSAVKQGDLHRLRLAEDGLQDATPGDRVRATGIVTRSYGQLLLTLAASWNVHAFYYDWRKSLDIAAAKLHAQLSTWLPENEPVHLIAHGMGGLVARSFIAGHQERWGSMWDPGDGERAPGTRGGRLIMLSTPNLGSFEVVRTLFGLGTVELLASLAPHGSIGDLAQIYASFVSPWQMLPSTDGRPELEPLYHPRTYGDRLRVPASRIELGRRHHKRLSDVVDASRMICINGSNRATVDGIADFGKLGEIGGYTATWDGDGWVPASMSQLMSQGAAGKEVATYRVDADHGGLPSNEALLAALDDLLLTGTTDRLPEPQHLSASDPGAALDLLKNQPIDGTNQLDSILRRSSAWNIVRDTQRSGRYRGTSSVAPARADERELEEFLTRGILHANDHLCTSTPSARRELQRIEIRIIAGHIDDFDDTLEASADGMPIDAVSVGLYLGSTPLIETRDLDVALSAPRLGLQPNGHPLNVPDADLLITQFAERGTIKGELGQTFLFDDPRSQGTDRPPRLIAVVGMGPPGRFGEPELTLVARELCWTLGQLGKRHLATALIGIGRGNLSAQDATLAFLRGIKHAVTGNREHERRALTRVSFVEPDPANIALMEAAIVAEKKRLQAKGRLELDFTEVPKERLAELKAAYQPPTLHARDPESPRVSRLTVTRKTTRAYRFGAITDNAAIPEREIVIDPLLVAEANDGLVAARKQKTQLEEGEVLEKLLLPAELRGQIYSDVPLVLMLDNSMARIHWEMMVNRSLSGGADSADGDGEDDPDRWNDFLGTGRGVTRQLRTTFSQPPDPPPPPRRSMRVLIVADPAADNPLPGAEAEGAAIERLFKQFNAVYEHSENRVEVVSLLGPQEATRKNVMKHLLLRSYDVLHFAGHCRYVENRPEESGWVFTGKQLITAAELNRIDRIPNFIFSNACESGVTPDRSEERSASLGPSFAEAFFERGVTNFVCTAWPVNDSSARDFALALYQQMLGLELVDEGLHGGYRTAPPRQMHTAMREARLRIANQPMGVGSWGAYQHYGNPYMRFFTPPRDALHDQALQ